MRRSTPIVITVGSPRSCWPRPSGSTGGGRAVREGSAWNELPEQLRTREGRRAALRQAKLELDSERDEQTEEDPPPDDDEAGLGHELDVARLMAGPKGGGVVA